MKILLINPSQEKVYGKAMPPAYAPLGILYIGAALKGAGHTVMLVDIDTEKIDEEKFAEIFKGFDPDAVGVTGVTPTIKNAFKWAALSKELKKGLPVVLGGIHATIASSEVIREKSIDIVVVGEGEVTAKELFNELSKDKPDLKNIKGICYKEGEKVIKTESRPLIEDLNSISFPDRTLIKNRDAFMPPDATRLPVATIMTSRGCPGDCVFCCTKNIFSKRFRARSVANITEEVERLIIREGIKEIHIADDTFTLNKNRVLEFCNEIKKRKIDVHFQFMNGLRADFVDKDILVALRGIGMKSVGFGVESGSERILKSMRKNIPLDVTRKAFRLSRELGFETWAFFIFGMPDETEETMMQSIKFARELDPDFAKFLVLKPFPGSDIHAQLDRAGLIKDKDYDNYGVYTKPVHNLPAISPERILYWQKKAFRDFYLRPRKIISHMARLRSWEQLRVMKNGLMFMIYCMFRRDKGG